LWGYLESNQGPLLYQRVNEIGQKGETWRDGVGRKGALSRDNGFWCPTRCQSVSWGLAPLVRPRVPRGPCGRLWSPTRPRGRRTAGRVGTGNLTITSLRAGVLARVLASPSTLCERWDGVPAGRHPINWSRTVGSGSFAICLQLSPVRRARNEIPPVPIPPLP